MGGGVRSGAGPSLVGSRGCTGVVLVGGGGRSNAQGAPWGRVGTVSPCCLRVGWALPQLRCEPSSNPPLAKARPHPPTRARGSGLARFPMHPFHQPITPFDTRPTHRSTLLGSDDAAAAGVHNALLVVWGRRLALLLTAAASAVGHALRGALSFLLGVDRRVIDRSTSNPVLCRAPSIPEASTQ